MGGECGAGRAEQAAASRASNEPRRRGGGEGGKKDKHLGIGPYAEALSCPSKFGCP